jgi:hypothetical protein
MMKSDKRRSGASRPIGPFFGQKVYLSRQWGYSAKTKSPARTGLFGELSVPNNWHACEAVLGYDRPQPMSRHETTLCVFKFQFGWTVVRRTGESNPSGRKQPVELGSIRTGQRPVPTQADLTPRTSDPMFGIGWLRRCAWALTPLRLPDRRWCVRPSKCGRGRGR